MALLEGGEGVPVGALTVEVHGQDGFDGWAGVSAEDCFDGGGGEVEGGGVDVGEEGSGSAAKDGADGGEEAEGSGDYGVAGADAGGGHGQPEGVGAAGAAYCVRNMACGGCGGFKAFDLWAEDEALGGADFFDGGEYGFPYEIELTGEIKHGDGLRNTFWHV